jgi:hypothetical protein
MLMALLLGLAVLVLTPSTEGFVVKNVMSSVLVLEETTNDGWNDGDNGDWVDDGASGGNNDWHDDNNSGSDWNDSYDGGSDWDNGDWDNKECYGDDCQDNGDWDNGDWDNKECYGDDCQDNGDWDNGDWDNKECYGDDCQDNGDWDNGDWDNKECYGDDCQDNGDWDNGDWDNKECYGDDCSDDHKWDGDNGDWDNKECYGDDCQDNGDWGDDDDWQDDQWNKNSKQQIDRELQWIEREFQYIDTDELVANDLFEEVEEAIAEIRTLAESDQIEEAWESLEYFNENTRYKLNSIQELSKFSKRIKEILREIKQESKRFKQEGTSEEVEDLLDKAEDKAEDLLDNPPLDYDAPWKIWDSTEPECMKMGFSDGPFPMGGPTDGPMGGPMGGDFGGAEWLGEDEFKFDFDEFDMGPPKGHGGPGFNDPFEDRCSMDELLDSDTPFGYLDVARRLHGEQMRNHHEGEICEQAKYGILDFGKYIVPNFPAAYQAEAKEILEKGKRLVEKCESAEDKFGIGEKLEKLKWKAEDLMMRADLDMGMYEDVYEDGFDMGYDPMDLIGESFDRELIEAQLGDELGEEFFAKVVNQLLAQAKQMIMETVSKVMVEVKHQVKEKMAHWMELASAKPDAAAEVMYGNIEKTAGITESLQAMAEADPTLESEVDDAIEAINSQPLPSQVLSTMEDIADSAEALVANGGDATEELKSIEEYLEGGTDEEWNKLRIAEGTQTFLDVTPGEGWYDVYADEAATKGVLSGAECGDYVCLDAGKTLNFEEGISMITNAAGLGEETPGSEISALGLPKWAAPKAQALANEIGVDKVKEVYNELGGVGGTMPRNSFAEVVVDVIEAREGHLEINVDDEIGHYTDFGQMNDETKHDFAVAHEYGIIEGGSDGSSNFQGEANRAEAAKMLSVLYDEVATDGGGGHPSSDEFDWDSEYDDYETEGGGGHPSTDNLMNNVMGAWKYVK